jgi:beta-phosphoglucomutase-like phosphatase (HAD superfamily)
LKRLIIFDFDGVLADSEMLSNTVLAEIVTELGVPTTLDESLQLFMGKRFHEVIAAVEAAVGHSLPDDFPESYQRRTLSSFRRDLCLIEGARNYIEAFLHIPRCIATARPRSRVANLTRISSCTRQNAWGLILPPVSSSRIALAVSKLALQPG